jgi:hypothetical protein
MNLRHRPMRPGDIPECVDFMANHPVIGPRYGPAIEDLPEVWRGLLECEARIAVVILAGEGSRAPICFSGISSIVHDDFLREMKTPPHSGPGPN